MPKYVPQRQVVKLTDVAAIKVKEFIRQAGKPSLGLRVSVVKDACDCSSYALELEDKARERAIVSEEHGVRIFVESKSAEGLQGSEIDYIVAPKGSGFKITSAGDECGPECACE